MANAHLVSWARRRFGCWSTCSCHGASRWVPDHRGCRRAALEVGALRVDVAAHARVLRVRVAAVAGGHPGSDGIEGHVQEDGQLPQTVQLVAMQEQPIEHEHDARGRNNLWQVEVLVGTEVVHGGAVPTRTGVPKWVEQVASQPVVVEGVQPEPTR